MVWQQSLRFQYRFGIIHNSNLHKAHRVVKWSRNEDLLTADWKIFNRFTLSFTFWF